MAGETVRPERRHLVLALGLIAALAALYLAWPIWRAAFPLEIDVDEPWNAYHADAVLAGRAVYPDPASLIVNNYPPLSFYLVAGLSKLFGLDAVYVGRILSLLAVAVIALAVGSAIRRFGGTRMAAGLGALWFVATAARFFEYVGKNDPHLPGAALSIAALAWLLRREARGRAAEPAILLMALAGFYKHSLIATPAAALLWLWTRNRALALRAAAVGVAAVGAGLALCVAVYGTDFIEQLLFPREHRLRWAFDNLGRLQWIAPALVAVLIWLRYDWGNAAARFVAIYLATAFTSYFLQKLGHGPGDNAQFELIAATAIGLGLAFDRIAAIPAAARAGALRARLVLIAILIARLLVSSRVEVYLLAGADYRAAFARNTAVMEHEVARVRAVDGLLDCDIMTVCRRAGKPFAYDPFAMEERVRTGRLTRAELDARLKERGIRPEAIDPRAGMQSLYRRW